MSREEFIGILYDFTCHNMSAAKAARRAGKQRNTINVIYHRLRERLAEVTEAESPFTQLDDEGRFKGVYNGVEFIRGCDAVSVLRPMVIGVFRPALIHFPVPPLPTVLTEVLPNIDRETLRLLNSGEYRLRETFPYDELLGTYFNLGMIGVDDRDESFYHFFYSRMKSFHGIPPQTRYLHLKENEWRFNHRRENKVAGLLEILTKYPL